MPVFEFAGFRLDTVKRLLTHTDGPVVLAPRAIDVLCVLVARAGQTVEKDELLREVWGSTVVEENTLARNVLLIRKALGESAGNNRFISTVAGRGYRFVHPVVLVTSEESPAAPEKPRWFRVQVLAAPVLIIMIAIAALGWRIQPKGGTFLPGSVDYATRNGSVLKFAVSPDGRTLAYASGVRTRPSLHIRDLSRNQESELLKAAGLQFMGLTIQEPWLFFVARDAGEQTGSAYRIPLAGGPAEKLFPDVESPVAFSPDGRIAFVREDRGAGESRLIISRPDGSQARVAGSAKLPSYLDYPAWSPDGRQLVTTKIDREDNHLLVFDAASGSARRLGGRWGFPMYPRWMPNGREVVLVANAVDAAVRQLWSVSVPDGTAKPVTRDLDDYSGLSVANDGRTLFAVNGRLATSIWTQPAHDPTAARQIAFGTDLRSSLVWTRRGSLVYESKGKLWRISHDGGSPEQLTWEGESYHPSECRESGDLLFIHNIGQAMFFKRINSNGQMLLRSPIRMAASPECAPNGRWMVFVDGRKPGYPLVRVDLDTNRETVLSSSKTAAAAIFPDGARVAQLAEEPDGLHILPASGGLPLQSFSLPAGNNAVSGVVRSTPDGRGIAYIDRSGAGNVWVQSLAGGPPKQHTNLNNERVLSFDWSADGKQLGMIRASTVQDVVMIHGQRTQ